MSDLKFISNHVPRNMIFGYELSETQKADFDYLMILIAKTSFAIRGLFFILRLLRLSDDSEEKKAGGTDTMNECLCAIPIKIVDCDKVIMGRGYVKA